MKLVTFTQGHAPRLGAQMGEFVLDLNRAQPSLPTDMLAFLDAGEAAMALTRETVERADAKFRLPQSDVTLLAPIPRPGKIICVGHNYHGHTGATPPTYPDIFAKFNNVVLAPGQPILLPRIANQVDYEGELAVVIGARARNLPEDRALDVVAGYTIFNDVSARDFQKRQSQWTMGKTFDTFGPLGPALVTRDEIAHIGALDLSLWVNGELRQHANTRDLIFSVPFLVAYLSSVMTLEPGDLISTGTPSGTGASHTPPIILRAGDVVKIAIEHIGVLENPVAAEIA
ncbi:MAG: fumarylacetoacetate hydrolase family protein [Chloroflexi bacterium]|nr:fumarylacetoacetate hydrolase family protein [Chloroflexota bacterium]